MTVYVTLNILWINLWHLPTLWGCDTVITSAISIIQKQNERLRLWKSSASRWSPTNFGSCINPMDKPTPWTRPNKIIEICHILNVNSNATFIFIFRHNLRLFQGLKFRWQAKRWTHWTKKTVASNHLHNYETKKAAIFRRRDARIPGKGNSLPFLINRRHLGSGLRFSWSTQHHVHQFLAFTKPSSQNLRRREATFDTRTKNSPCLVDKMRWKN